MTIETTQYLKLKSAEAPKLGRKGGSIGYELSELMNNPGRAKHPDWQLLMKQDKGN